MRIVQPGDPTYDSSRRISNARFDYRPRYICYCENAGDVQTALSKAKNEKLGVRIRSGGHQHEGMCSAAGVLIIDLSEIHNITFSDDLETVWIGAGAKLADVYQQTRARNRILPGGGWGDVRVGGLVQGGGWGPYSRALGLTCDRLFGFRIVMASGERIEVDGAKSDPYNDLFWAVLGGGGGNFGVITEFHFKLAGLPFPIWQFTVTWNDPSLMQPVIEEWRRNFPNDEEFRLTSFCRLSGTGGQDPPVIVAGFFLGDQAPLKALLQRLLPSTYVKGKAEFSPVHATGVSEPRRVFHHPEYQPGPPLAALRSLSASAEGAPGDLSTTCDGGWYPHKVSSCFPRSDFSDAATQTIVSYLAQTLPEPNARRYLSLHSMGGTMKGDPVWNEWSCFAFRDKPYVRLTVPLRDGGDARNGRSGVQPWRVRPAQPRPGWRKEGRALSCPPSAVADAGNGLRPKSGHTDYPISTPMRSRQEAVMQQQSIPGVLSQPQRRIFYGWWIVAIGRLQDAVKGGTFNSGFSLYFLPVLDELHLSRAATSLPFSLAKLEAAVIGPIVGYLLDRFDLRVMMVLGTISAGLGFVLLAYTHSYLTFLLVFMCLLSMGFQMGFNHGSMAAVNYWFRAKRGLAMSVLQTGQAIGGVVLFPLVALAVLKLGWRSAAMLSGAVVFLMIPLVLLIRRSPESMGLLPDGECQPQPIQVGGMARPARASRELVELTTREALKTSSFWLLAGFHSLRNLPYGGVTVHLVPLLVWKGLDQSTAAFFVGLMSFCAVVVRPLTGWLGDRWSKQKIGAVGVILGGLGLGVLLYSNGAFWYMTVFVVLFSFADSINSVTWALAGDFFGRKNFATIRGWIGMLQSFATMPAAVFTGWVYDQTQSYTAALLPFILLYWLAALVLWKASPPRPRL